MEGRQVRPGWPLLLLGLFVKRRFLSGGSRESLLVLLGPCRNMPTSCTYCARHPAFVTGCSLSALGFEWELTDQAAKWHHLYHQLRRYRSLYGTTDIDAAHSAQDGCDWRVVAW